MGNISTEYIRNLLSKKLDDEISYFKERKNQAEFIKNEIRFFSALCMIVLHICLRQDSGPLERISAIVVSFVMSAQISKRFFERKMEEITSHWDDFHNLMSWINPLIDKDSIPATESENIEKDLHGVTTNSSTKKFIKGYLFESLIHAFCLSTGLLFFFYVLDSSVLDGLYSLLFSYFTSKTVLHMRDMYII